GGGGEEGGSGGIGGRGGEVGGVLRAGKLEVTRHGEVAPVETIEIQASPFGHSGGDQGLLDHFCRVVSRGALDEVRASGRVALESHLMGFAAERARREQSVVDMASYRAEV